MINWLLVIDEWGYPLATKDRSMMSSPTRLERIPTLKRNLGAASFNLNVGMFNDDSDYSSRDLEAWHRAVNPTPWFAPSAEAPSNFIRVLSPEEKRYYDDMSYEQYQESQYDQEAEFLERWSYATGPG